VEDDPSEGAPLQFSINVDWSEVDATPTQHVNQLVGQLGPPLEGGIPDGIYLAFGSIPPPLILGRDNEERRKVAEELSGRSVKVTVHGRFHMSREVLDSIVNVLQTTARQYDATVQLAASGKAEETQ
jgi:hypothetical protein